MKRNLTNKEFDKILKVAFRKAAELEQKDDLTLEEYNEKYPCPNNIDFSYFYEEVRCKKAEARRQNVLRTASRAAMFAIAVIALVGLVVFTPIRTIGFSDLYRERHSGYDQISYAPFLDSYKEQQEKYNSLDVKPHEYAVTYLPDGYYLDEGKSDRSIYEIFYLYYYQGDINNSLSISVYMSGLADHKVDNEHHTHEADFLADGRRIHKFTFDETGKVDMIIWGDNDMTFVIVANNLDYETMIKIIEGIVPIAE